MAKTVEGIADGFYFSWAGYALIGFLQRFKSLDLVKALQGADGAAHILMAMLAISRSLENLASIRKRAKANRTAKYVLATLDLSSALALIVTSAITLAKVSPVASGYGSIAFMWYNFVHEAYLFYRAYQKSNPYHLLMDRLNKYLVIKDDETRQEEQERLKAQVAALYRVHYQFFEEKNKLNLINEKLSKAEVIISLEYENDHDKEVDKEIVNCLYAKQDRKLGKRFNKLVSAFLLAVGVTLLGFISLCPALMPAGLAFIAVAMVASVVYKRARLARSKEYLQHPEYVNMLEKKRIELKAMKLYKDLFDELKGEKYRHLSDEKKWQYVVMYLCQKETPEQKETKEAKDIHEFYQDKQEEAKNKVFGFYRLNKDLVRVEDEHVATECMDKKLKKALSKNDYLYRYRLFQAEKVVHAAENRPIEQRNCAPGVGIAVLA